MPTFERTEDADEIIETLIATKPYHKDLSAVEITIDVLAYNGEDDEPLKLRGTTVWAYVKANTKKERALGLRDATIVIDAKQWERLTEPRKVALMDHELYHLTVAKDKDDAPKKDDLGRPILRMRSHDVELGWFREIAQEHGEDSPEVIGARLITTGSYGQAFFSFMSDNGAISAKREEAPPANETEAPAPTSRRRAASKSTTAAE